MSSNNDWTRITLLTVGVMGWVGGNPRPAEATPPVGVTAKVLSRAVVPEFDVARRFRESGPQQIGQPNRGLPSPKRHANNGVWKIELEATRMIEVWTVLFTVAPYGHGGWHTHPGPAIFTVTKGTLTLYDGDDPSCTPHVYPAGTGSIEADTDAHIHITRNETGVPVETVVTFLVPFGVESVRVDLDDPGHCVFPF
jgi:hypothetical protein